MRKKNLVLILFLLIVLTLFLLSSKCGNDVKPNKPDLIVKLIEKNWDDMAPINDADNMDNKIVTVVVENIGDAPAGNFMVYVTPEENPMSSNHRPQISFKINGLGQGETSEELVADFSQVSHMDNNYIGNVVKINAMADPKGMVAESNENNNDLVIELP